MGGMAFRPSIAYRNTAPRGGNRNTEPLRGNIRENACYNQGHEMKQAPLHVIDSHTEWRTERLNGKGLFYYDSPR